MKKGLQWFIICIIMNLLSTTKELLMGAYFQKQLSRPCEPTIVVKNSMMKFCECNYFANDEERAIYRYLQEHATKENPITVKTVCDYDEKEHNLWVSRGDHEAKDGSAVIFVDHPMERDSDDWFLSTEGEVSEQFKKFRNEFFVTGGYKPQKIEGYLVCDEDKSFIDLKPLSDYEVKIFSDHGDCILYSPLALLTRLSAEYMGGGDFSFHDEYDYECVGAWYGKPIYYTTEKPSDDYQDITKFVTFDWNCKQRNEIVEK